jgi:hypothetical protein
MKESYTEGIANHSDPESCACIREDMGEALTGAHAGRVLSRVITDVLGADAVQRSGRQHVHGRYREDMNGPARSKTPSTYGTFLRGNREILDTAHGDGPAGRTGKAKVSRR